MTSALRTLNAVRVAGSAVNSNTVRSFSTSLVSKAKKAQKDAKHKALLQHDAAQRKKSLNAAKDPEIFLSPPKLNFKPMNGSEDLAAGQTYTMSSQGQQIFDTYGLPFSLNKEVEYFPTLFLTIRECTKQVGQKIEAGIKNKKPKNNAIAIAGRAGSGKTITLLQIAEYFSLKNWIVLYIPDAYKLVDSSSRYSYDPKNQMFLQPDLCMQTLKDLLKLYKEPLNKIQSPVPNSKSLLQYIQSTVSQEKPSDEDLTLCFENTIETLCKQEESPFLIAIDNAQTLFQDSQYRSSDNSKIPTTGLTVPRTLLEIMGGFKPLKNGAIVVTNTSNTKTGKANAYEIGLGQREQEPYEDLDLTLSGVASNLERVDIPHSLSRTEAASIAKSLSEAGIIRQLSDLSFITQYVQSGGNARLFTKGYKFALT